MATKQKINLSVPGSTAITDGKGVLKQEWRLWFNKIYQRLGGDAAYSNTDLEDFIININSQVDTINTTITTLQTELNNVSDEIILIQNNITTINDNITILQNSITDINNNINTINNSITTINNSITTINTTLSSLTTQVNTNTSDIATLNSSVIKTIASVGAGISIWLSKVGNTANFKSLKAGTNITLDNTTNPNEIVINSTGGGSSTSKGFGDLTINVDTVGPTPVGSFTISGGEYWTTSRNVQPSNATTVPNFTSTSKYIYLEANTSYYVYFNYYSKSFSVEKNPTSWSFTVNSKLLWVIKTDTTKITSAIDYRGMDIMIRPRTLLMVTQWYSGARTYTFNMSDYYYLNQIPTASEINGVLGQFPRYMRWQSSMLCVTADAGYSPGEEADYTTGDGVIWGKPIKVNNNGNFDVYQGAQCKIWQASTNTWVDPTASRWAMVAKVSLEYH